MTSSTRKLTAFGECMIEFSRSPDGDSWMRRFADDSLNTAWYFRRLAPADWTTSYFTAVGDDAPSRDLVRFFEDNGISASYVRTVPNTSPGLYLIELKKAERQFSYWRDQSAARRFADDAGHLAKAMSESDIVYFSGITLAILPPARRAEFIATLADVRRHGITVVFDPNIRKRLWAEDKTMAEAILAAAATASIVLPTFPDEQEVFGDRDPVACADRYRKLGADLVVVKNGEHPCLGVSDEEVVAVAAVPVAAPIDTTGAGDSFNGAFLAARAAGEPLEKAIATAHVTGARTICGYGALVV